LDLFQHPKLVRTAYRLPAERQSDVEAWENFGRHRPFPNLSIQTEWQQAKQQVWIRLEGALSAKDAEGLARRLCETLARSRSRLVLDVNKLHWDKINDLRPLRALAAYRTRVRLVVPKLSAAHPELLLLASMFHHYHG
jgi:hypothetical protein